MIQWTVQTFICIFYEKLLKIHYFTLIKYLAKIINCIILTTLVVLMLILIEKELHLTKIKFY